mgnify:CR=1 FL=1
MSIDTIKIQAQRLETTYSTISGQIEKVIETGLSKFDIIQLDALTSQVILSLQKNNQFCYEVSKLLKELSAFKTTQMQSLPQEELESIEKALEQIKNNCRNHGLSLSHLDSLLKTKQLSVDLFNRQSPTQLPTASCHFIRALKAGEPLQPKQKLGEGQFGIVHKASIGPLQLAKKTIRVVENQDDYHDPEKLERESALLLGMDHPNIVQIVATTINPPALYMLEANRNSLFSSYKNKAIYIPENLLSIFEGVTSALTYLHDTIQLCHCDLHPGNILIEEKDRHFTGLLTDFEFSSKKSSGLATEGNKYTQAPETLIAHSHIKHSYLKLNRIKRASMAKLRDEASCEKEQIKQEQIMSYLDTPISEKNDIWALGISLFATLTCGKSPYEVSCAKEKNLIRSALKLNQPANLTSFIQKSKPRQVSCGSLLYHDHPITQDLVVNVISQCFQLNPALRPSAAEINKYFQQKLAEIQIDQALSELAID